MMKLTLTFLQTNNFDLADINVCFNGDLNGALGHLFVGKVHEHGILSWALWLILNSKGTILVVYCLNRHIHPTFVSHTYGYITYKI